MIRRFLLMVLCACCCVAAAELAPATVAAFDRYVKLTEQSLEGRKGPHDFLWLDQHPKEKDLIWLGQSVVTPVTMLDQGQAIQVPDGTLQDWLGTILLEHATLDRVRDFVLNYGDYKFYFKQFFTDSKLVKREGDTFDAFLRLSRKQFTGVVLNMNLTCSWVLLDPTHGQVTCHSTHIGEVAHPKAEKQADQERAAADSNGYLWRQNIYWRMVQTGDGVFVQLESITLTRPASGLNPGRFLNGFVQSYPREFVEGSIEALQQGFPRPKPGHH